MSRRMSCSMTIDAVRERQKTVTRRHVDTWRNLKAGDRLTLIEKGMGLAKGASQVVLAEVEVVSVRKEQLVEVLYEMHGTAKEGLGHMDGWSFVDFWMRSHGYHPTDINPYAVPCRRIEWRYLDADPIGDAGASSATTAEVGQK